MGESVREMDYNDILDKKLAELLPDIQFNTITAEEFTEYQKDKEQVAQLKKQLEQKEQKLKEFYGKAKELQEKFNEAVKENNKLKEKASVQPKILEEFRTRLIKEAWLYFSDPKARVILQNGYTLNKDEYIKRMKKVAIPQQNTVTRTTNTYNNASNLFTEVVNNGQTAQQIKTTI